MDKLSSRCAPCLLLALLNGCTAAPADDDGQLATAGTGGASAIAGAAALPPSSGAAPIDPGLQGPAPMTPSTQAGAPAAVPPVPTMPTEPVPNEPTPPVEPAPVWQPLISASWELAPNEETTYCQRVTLTEDVYFRGVRALNPPGTHHTATTVGAPSAGAPDGLTRDCGSALSPQGIFGSGVGTDQVIYPPGVGLRLRAGQQVLLNLHVYNSTDQPLAGTSGTEIVVADPGEVEHVAESLLAGPTFFSLPPGQTTKISGQCTVTAPSTLFAVQPHMHKLGVHMKGVAQTAAGEVMLHDGPFDFENQVVVPIEPLAMQTGDVIDVECTFDNQTGQTVTLGESSDTEMCFLVLHRYPAAEPPNVLCRR
jgi:hypothetical protein